MQILGVLTVFLSIAVPWATGACIARLALGKAQPVALYLGHGLLLGYVVVIACFALFNLAKVPLNFLPVLAIVAFTGLAAGVLAWRTSATGQPRLTAPSSTPLIRSAIPLWQWALIGLLAVMTVYQLKFLHDEVLLRPTFPWDAWRGWEPETLQHFQEKALNAPIQTVGNYGTIASQIHLWTMLAAQSGKEPITHIPWLFAYVAIGLAVFGQLRLRYGLLASAIGGFACLSLPYLSIHTALAGYADIWLMLAFTLGVFSLVIAHSQTKFSPVALFGIYLLITLLSKRAGIPMSIALIASLAFGFIRWTPARIAVVASVPLLLAGLIAAAIYGYVSIDTEIPQLGHLQLNETLLKIPFVTRYEFMVSLDAQPFADAIFAFGSWHLTAALLLACVLVLMTRNAASIWLTLPVFGVFSALTLIIGFFVALSPESAKDQSALSRALLYTAPLAILAIIAIAAPAPRSGPGSFQTSRI